MKVYINDRGDASGGNDDRELGSVMKDGGTVYSCGCRVLIFVKESS